MRWFDGLAVLVVAGLAAYLAIQPPLRELEGPAYDLLLRARLEIYGKDFSSRGLRAQPSPVVVVALDQETGLRPPFDRLPQELWTPQIAEVMRRTLDAGALVLAQQQAFATSGDAAIEGYDADYLAVLSEAAKQRRMVLGRRAPAPDRLGPAPAHAEAVGADRNVRHIALYPDPDGVLRHAALYEDSHDRTGNVSVKPTLALELAARVIGERPHLLNGSDLLLGRHAVPGSEINAMLLNFQGGDGGIPVFSLGDLYACSQDGEEGFFRKHFDDKVVIFGRTDGPRWRRVTAARFLDVRSTDRYAERCRLPLMLSLVASDHGSDATGTMPEVLVSATAVRNLLLREGVKSLSAAAVFFIVALLALAVAWAVLRIDSHIVAPAVLVVAAGWGYLAVVMLARETWLMPLAQPASAVALAFAAAWIYRALRRF
ncbi:MAG: CHASE2 domain-containing protein [Kiloniellaceae bacterium]